MKKLRLLLVLPVIFAFCLSGKTSEKSSKSKLKETTMINAPTTVDDIIKAMTLKFGTTDTAAISKAVKQVAALWTASDGNLDSLKSFCLANYAKPGADKKALFDRLSTNFEVLFGHFTKISLDLKVPLQLDNGEMIPVDDLFGAYDPYSHLTDDFFNNKIAFIVILNFPHYSLTEKEALGEKWPRLQWAYAKMGDVFTSRVPASILQNMSDALSASDTYIATYNVYMGKLVDSKMKTYFPADLKLITHWGLRDELKADYADADGLAKQKMIYEVMKRIISQEIPKEVIDKNDYQWDPITNKLYKDSKEVVGTPEKNIRYQYLLDNFKAGSAIDKYSPLMPTFIQRKFEGEMQLTQAEVEKLFISFLTSPTVKKVADLIALRLNRKLQPFDIWYDGFKSRSTISDAELTKAVRTKYPTIDVFAKDLPNILVKFGTPKEKASWICSKIDVDPSRGAGHASGADMKTDKAHLRTRFGKDGMDYKGYNIAVHEFGHTVEQTITLNDIDYYMLRSVPNTGYTEAMAFMFQQRDLELLGYKSDSLTKKANFALDNFWSVYEIMGVSLVDMGVWKWMYTNPNATADELKVATIKIAKDVWNKYYADIFGSKDEPILAIYSHMIEDPLYLSNYPVGHLVDFQVEKYMEGKSWWKEFDRILLSGSITPQQWMKNAVGKELSAQAMIDATNDALLVIKK